MKYRSTRGEVGLSFEEAVFKGLASDGGLLIPESVPKFSQDELNQLKTQSYQEIAFSILRRFIDQSEINDESLKSLINKSFSDNFRVPTIVELVRPKHQQTGECDKFILELFHGPSYSFKDVALQFLGNLFEFFIMRKNSSGTEKHFLTVVGATSGDTGSAAIYGLRGKEGIQVYILHPDGRISPIQEKQMTTVLDENVFNVKVRGTFDDCQTIVKTLFKDKEFNSKYHLGAINSINWARILVQTTYYFFSYFQIVKQLKDVETVNYAVPTGNFGDILAGHYSKRLGLPIDRLMVCTNQNDILHRFFSQGKYHKFEVKASCSPAMDIQTASNLERFLSYIANDDSSITSDWMNQIEVNGKLTFEGELLEKVQKEMISSMATEQNVYETIRRYNSQYNYVADPHTSVGLYGVDSNSASGCWCVLSTAHPAKFLEAVHFALKEDEKNQLSDDDLPGLPDDFKALLSKPTRSLICDNDPNQVKQIISENFKSQ